MKVLKFGGSSVATAERILHIVSIVKPRIEAGEKMTIVFSAFGGVTDMLIEMSELASQGKDKYIALYHQFKDRHSEAAKELLSHDKYTELSVAMDEHNETLKDLLKGIFLVREASLRTMDYVLSFGERNANFIIAEAMKEKGINAEFLDARKIIKTNKDFGSAKVNFKLTDPAIDDYYKEHDDKVQIVTGFIGSDIGGLTTTLGRGGSDYTAAILAGALHAEELEIWTDVDGVLTCDPRKVKQAFTIPQLSYAEAMEMSHFGAKVIYPPTIQPALRKGIPIYIKNTFNPGFVGTLIHKEHDPSFKSMIKGISSLGNLSLIRLQGSGMMGVPGVSARLFTALGKEKINVILITQASSEHSISLAVTDKEAMRAIIAISEEFEREIGKAKEVLLQESKRMFNDSSRDWTTNIANWIKDTTQNISLQIERNMKDLLTQRASQMNQEKIQQQKQQQSIDLLIRSIQSAEKVKDQMNTRYREMLTETEKDLKL